MGIIVSVLTLGRRRRNRREATYRQLSDQPRFGLTEDQGDRPYMEDATYVQMDLFARKGPRAFFAVCDGHGGRDAARFASKNILNFLLAAPRRLRKNIKKALRTAFLKTDKEFEKEVTAGRLEPSGTTALVAVLTPGKLAVSNLGDCRAILSKNGTAEDVAVEHKPDSLTERRRIEVAGGFIDCEGYLNGDLGVSRAIGDFHLPHLKKSKGNGPLIAEPDVTEVELGDSAEFLILSSDGVWMQSQTVVNIVRDSLRKHNCPEIASRSVVSGD